MASLAVDITIQGVDELRDILEETARAVAQFHLARKVELRAREIGSWYRHQGEKALPMIERTLGAVQESGDRTLFVERIETAITRIMDEVLSFTRTEGSRSFEKALQDGAVYGHEAGRTMLGLSTSFTLRHEDAEAWSRENATKRIVTVEGATKDRVKEIVVRGIEVGTSPATIGRSLREFFTHRAKGHSLTVARTETAFGYESGNRMLISDLQDAGLTMEKAWHRTGSEDCQICEDNEKEGYIPADQDHSSGDPHPPGHPNCLCWEEYRRADGEPIDEEEILGGQAEDAGGGFSYVPVKSSKEFMTRVKTMVPSEQIEGMSRLTLDQQNAILRGLEKSAGRHGATFDRIRTGPSVTYNGKVTFWPASGRQEMTLESNYVKNASVQANKVRNAHEIQVERNIAIWKDRLARELNPREREVLQRQIDVLRRVKRATVSSDFEESLVALESTACHEGYHTIDNACGRKLRQVFAERVRKEGLEEYLWEVSEYAASGSTAEAWAEVGTAREMGVPINARLAEIHKEIADNAAKVLKTGWKYKGTGTGGFPGGL